MPYGLQKILDTKDNNAKIERCIEEQVKKDMDKELAVRICKASVAGTTKRKRKS